MFEKVIIGNAELYRGDCLEILPLLPKVDAVITDPPYGIGICTRVSFQERQEWDMARIDPRPFLEIGEKHLFWGGQYIAELLPASESWLVWVKRPLDGIKKSQCHSTVELAWADWGKARFKKHVWDGGKREGKPENRLFCHPSQKPVEVMEWCLEGVVGVVLDPYMGSGTTGVACTNLGLPFIGVEKEKEFFDIACERIENAQRQQRLFA